MKSEKKTPPYVNFAADLSGPQLTAMHRRMRRSPHKFKFTETPEAARRKLFTSPIQRKRRR